MCILVHVCLDELLHAGTGRRQSEPGGHSSATVLQQVEREKRVEERQTVRLRARARARGREIGGWVLRSGEPG